MLRANFNAGAPQYLDNFGDFVLAVLDTASKAMSRSQISDVVRKRFGLSIPALVIGKILKRLRHEGLAVEAHADGHKITSEGQAAVPKIEEAANRVRERQVDLARNFRQFVSDYMPGEVHLVPEDGFGDLLVAYIEKHSVRVLARSLRGEAWQETPINAEQDYVTSRYVAHVISHDITRLEYIEDLSKGAVLASVLSLDTLAFAQSLKGTSFYLDTPVVLNLLGLHGDIPRNATDQLVKLMIGQGAEVSVFEHTVRETTGLLEGVEHSLSIGSRSRSTNAVYFHCVETGLTAADLRLVSSKLSQSVRQVGINVRPKPEGYDKYGLDEGSLESKLQSYVHYRESATRIFDVDSLSAIHRLRRGIRSSKLEDTSAVLVTNNSEIVRASREFDGEKRRFPLALTEESIAGLLWVRSPSISDAASRQQIIATAFAGLNPRRQPWMQFLEQVDSLVESGDMSDEDALILRTTKSSREAFMELTLGSAEVTPESPNKVLARLKSEARKEEVELRKAAVSRSESLELEASTLTSRIAELETHAAHQAAVMGAESARRLRVLRGLEARADTYARRVVVGPLWVLLSLVALSFLVDGLGFGQSNQLLALIIRTVLGFATGLALILALVGRGVFGVFEPLKGWVRTRRLRHLKEIAGETDE